MTILFVTHYTGLYGANRSMLSLIRLLQTKHAIRPIVIVPFNQGPLLESLRDHDISYYVLPSFNWVATNMETQCSRYRCFKWNVKNILRVFKIRSKLKRQQIDLVYSNSVTTNIGAILALVLNVPHIWHFRESIQQFGLRRTMPRLIAKLVIYLHTNKRFILISDFMVHEYQKLLPVSKVRRIYNGVSLPFDCRARSYNRINNKLQIVCVGVLCPQKNQIELLKAIVKLKERNCQVHAHFVGVDTLGYMKEMTKYIDAHHIGDMVTIHGHSNNVFEILRVCNLGIVTAKDEAFGRVTIEYMLMRMPIVAAKSGANEELIDNGYTGTIYHLGDVSELAESIQTYIDNSNLLEEQGKHAYAKAVNEFSAEKNAEFIYDEMLNILQ